jgi:hypothetical protein
MSKVSTTVDNDGDVVSILTEPVMATISFSRTVTFANTFGAKEECGVFLQVPISDTSSPEAIEAEIAPQFALAKGFVYTQLGLDATVQENGVVSSPAQVGDAPKAKGKGGGGRPSGAAASNAPLTDEEKADLWARLAGAQVNGANFKDGSETVWDNRVGKRNPKGPDFKWADSGHALWLKDAPNWFAGPGEGIEV